MKDKYFEWFTYRPLCVGKIVPGAAVTIFALLSPGMAIAEPGIVEGALEKEIVFTRTGSESVAPRRQPLSLDIVSGAAEGESTIASEPEEPAPVLAKLVPDSHGSISATKEQSTVSAAASESLSVANDELPQVPYALILALLALITVVPMSRRRH